MTPALLFGTLLVLLLLNIPIGVALGLASITALVFGAISGSNPATVAAIGGIMIPAMVKAGYPRDFAAAVAAAGGDARRHHTPEYPDGDLRGGGQRLDSHSVPRGVHPGNRDGAIPHCDHLGLRPG
ncbi:MAG: TRAP transporter large permease subunit [Firmicutes bacterium]|nr:TRAP transporter large permease subunit [Bacillota bacterium]